MIDWFNRVIDKHDFLDFGLEFSHIFYTITGVLCQHAPVVQWLIASYGETMCHSKCTVVVSEVHIAFIQ